MKKFFTLRNIVLAAGALVAVVGVVLACLAGLRIEDGALMEFKNFVFGSTKIAVTYNGVTEEIAVSDMGLGIETTGLAVVPFIGLLLMGIGAIGACVVGLLVKKPFAKWIVLGCGVLALAGGVMQFFPVESFADAFVRQMYKDYPVSEADIQEVIKQQIEAFKEAGASAPLAIVAGVLGCVGGVAAGASAFLGKKGE